MNNPERFKNEFLEYQKSYQFLNTEEFLRRLGEKDIGKCLTSLFTEITDIASLELRDFEIYEGTKKLSGTKIIGISKEKTSLYQSALITLNYLETGDIFLKIFSKKDGINEDLIVFPYENKIKWAQSEKAVNEDFLEKIKISFKKKVLALNKDGNEITFDDQC